MQGKAACPAKAVPEETLSEYAAEFNSGFEKVEVCSGNNLIFHFYDGTKKEIFWQDRSRRESWTDEMKQKARETYYAGRNQNTSNEEQVHRCAD